MSVALYMDVHVPLSVTRSLRFIGADVITSQEDGTSTIEDTAILDRATILQRVLVTQDQDFLHIGAARIASGAQYSGIVFAPQSLSIGQLIRDLELIATIGELKEFANRVEFLPF